MCTCACGTRLVTDGMACFARAARSAVGVEANPIHCERLMQRARASGGAFTVRCEPYLQSIGVDADVFTWWQQTPHLSNVEVLQHLRRQQQAGAVRPTALAIMLFEVGHADDMHSYLRVRNLSSPQWSETVHFDEAALCKRRIRQRRLCLRARGSFHVVGIRLADVA